MNTAIGIVVAIMVLGGFLFAQSKIEKNDTGMVINPNRTYYANRIIWGEDYFDHDTNNPVHNTEVIAFGVDKDGNPWEFSTTTDDDGNFKVEVMPDVTFRIKASDGNRWAESADLTGVAEGTIKIDKS